MKQILTTVLAVFLVTQSMELVLKTVLSTTSLLLEYAKPATLNAMAVLIHAPTVSIVLPVTTNVDLFV